VSLPAQNANHLMNENVPPLDWHTFLTTWQVHTGWLIVCGGLVAAYLVGAMMCRRRGDPMHPVRVASFLLGSVLLALCLSSAIDAYAMSLFWMHMVEHLSLITVIPAFLVLGHPFTVLRNAGGPAWRAAFDEVVHRPPVAQLTHPLAGLVAYGLVVFYTHLTPFMDKMAMNPSLMTLEQVLYVGSGFWLLLGAIGDEPLRWHTPYLLRLALLILAMVPDTLVGIVLLQTTKDPFPMYMGMRPDWAPPPLRDLDIGGSLMWAAGDGLMMCLAIGVLLALLTRQRDNFLGTWLESARTATLVEHVQRTGGGNLDVADSTIDDDEAALDAYNDMLRRLGSSPPE
jgi:putative copper resistance protein D